MLSQLSRNNMDKVTLWKKEWTRNDGSVYHTYSGSMKLDGEEMWVNGSIKDVKKKDGTSTEVIELSFKPKQPKLSVDVSGVNF